MDTHLNIKSPSCPVFTFDPDNWIIFALNLQQDSDRINDLQCLHA